ncbi:MAG: 4-phosphopantetheinyl transferase family protein [Flavobacterium sp.]|nr:MAG: 4-phosphopantetheinyl transferase family protein [Flavobacterium sp.]
MIGNDIVDLVQARFQSNWKRKGFVQKIFTQKEQELIFSSKNPENMVWNLWTRKEAAYKIFNRNTQIRAFIPHLIECNLGSEEFDTVTIDSQIYYTQTVINEESIYTIAVGNKKYFSEIVPLSNNIRFERENGIPFLTDSVTNKKNPISITHHGRYWKGIILKI